MLSLCDRIQILTRNNQYAAQKMTSPTSLLGCTPHCTVDRAQSYNCVSVRCSPHGRNTSYSSGGQYTLLAQGYFHLLHCSVCVSLLRACSQPRWICLGSHQPQDCSWKCSNARAVLNAPVKLNELGYCKGGAVICGLSAGTQIMKILNRNKKDAEFQLSIPHWPDKISFTVKHHQLFIIHEWCLLGKTQQLHDIWRP